MKLEFHGKSLNYNLDGSLKGTIVTLGHMDGGHLPVLLGGDQTALSNQELFELAMEEHYQENFPNRAENEKFNLLGEKIAKYDELIEKSQNAITDLEEATIEAKVATVKNEEAVNNAVSELTELITGILGQSPTNILKGIFTMKFTKNHQIVKSWVALVLAGTYTVDQVPKLFNLQEVVIEVLSEQAAAEKTK